MTQPAMLAALAHKSVSSYVFRGRFIRKRLLCEPLGTPPGNAMTEFAKLPKPPDPTARDESAAVNARGSCTVCHSLIDPPGLAFEHFDAMGAYRDAYPSGKAIDTRGTYKRAGAEAPIEFSDPVDLLEALASEPATRACYARQVFRFMASRMDAKDDVCAIQQLEDAFTSSDGRLERVLLEATRTDAFVYRRGE
jgi:hypothetical protein